MHIPYQPEAVIRISALEQEGIEEVRRQTDLLLDQADRPMTLLIPYTEGSLIQPLHDQAVILEENYTEEGIRMRVRVKEPLLSKVRPFETENDD